MSFSCGFYDSIDHDRTYSATQFGEMFDGLIKDGVYSTIGEALMVVPGSGMSVVVKSGRAWFNKTWSANTADLPLSLEMADLLLPRIDAVVLEIDSRVAVRNNAIKVLTGSPAITPTTPVLSVDDSVHQYPLAYVTVPANATQIQKTNIDVQVGKGPCPFVTGILQSVDITDMYQQWEGQFEEWLAFVQSQLTDDVAGNLLDLVLQRVKISDKATESEALVGVSNDKWMTPALVKKASKYTAQLGIGSIVYSPESPGEDWHKCDGSSFSTDDAIARVIGPRYGLGECIEYTLSYPYSDKSNFNTGDGIKNNFLVVGDKVYTSNVVYANKSNVFGNSGSGSYAQYGCIIFSETGAPTFNGKSTAAQIGKAHDDRAKTNNYASTRLVKYLGDPWLIVLNDTMDKIYIANIKYPNNFDAPVWTFYQLTSSGSVSGASNKYSYKIIGTYVTNDGKLRIVLINQFLYNTSGSGNTLTGTSYCKLYVIEFDGTAFQSLLEITDNTVYTYPLFDNILCLSKSQSVGNGPQSVYLDISNLTTVSETEKLKTIKLLLDTYVHPIIKGTGNSNAKDVAARNQFYYYKEKQQMIIFCRHVGNFDGFNIMVWDMEKLTASIFSFSLGGGAASTNCFAPSMIGVSDGIPLITINGFTNYAYKNSSDESVTTKRDMLVTYPFPKELAYVQKITQDDGLIDIHILGRFIDYKPYLKGLCVDGVTVNEAPNFQYFINELQDYPRPMLISHDYDGSSNGRYGIFYKLKIWSSYRYPNIENAWIKIS